jgi:hypothetical protein
MTQPFDALNIRQIKLINGEEILALVTKVDQQKWTIERPVTIRSNMLGGYQLQPWFPFSQKKLFTIMGSDILAHVEIDLDVKETYVKAVTATPPRNSPPEFKTEEQLQAEYDELIDEVYNEEQSSKKTIH